MEKGVSSGLARWVWAALFVLGTGALLTGGYKYYQSETERIRQEKYQEIAAIGKLKAGQIEQWRQERLGDISRSAKAPFFGQGLREWLRDTDNASLRAKLQDRLVSEQKEQGYADVLLLDTDCNILLSAEPHPHPLISAAKKAIEQALTNRTPMLSALYRCPTGVVHADAVGPILDSKGRPLAALVLRSNAESLLYPLIQSWPTPSKTAETLLVRRDGDEVLFLNDLRHRPDGALSLREPLTRDDLPAVQAVLGKEGIFRGKDYRGVEVLASLRSIAGSPWFMVAKVDASEILAEARYRGGIAALFAALFIVLAASVTSYGYRYRQVRLYRDLYRSEREQRAALSEFRTTLYSIGDAVITADTGGLVKQMNPVAERLTGWQEVEAQGKPISEVFRIINEQTRAKVEDPVARVLREGLIVGLANHTLLIAKDGSEYPISDSGAPICDESGAITGVVLVFQDQTESQRRLDERETRLTLLHLLNEQNDTHEMIKNITAFLQKRSGCEAVGVRLKDGDDYPYFETRGFTQEFVQAESSLCGRDATGELLRESPGNPVLECMCGNVLSGRFNPDLPFFTAKGSFWSNCTTELLESTTEEDRQARTRNRCNGEGYESVALFRMRSGDKTLGLLQLNDHAKGRFTPELLDFMESTADEIAIALAHRQAQARLRESEERFSKSFRNNPAWLAIVHMGTNKTLEVNDAWTRIFGYTREEAIGRTTVELGIYDEETYRKIMEEAKAKGSVKNVEVAIKTRTGENRVLLVSREVIRIKGEPHLLAMGLDITDRKRAEEALGRRIIALTRPLEETEGIAFEDLFNLKEIQRLQDQFALACGVASIITHPDGTPITKPSNFCRLCEDIIRKTDKGIKNCYYSDSIIGRYNPDGPAVQPCLSGGLWDAGTSIGVGGRHIANWLIGQVRNETQDDDKMREYAREIGADPEPFLEAFHEVPSMSKEQFERVAQALFTLAGQLSTVAYQNVQQARFISERKRAEEALSKQAAFMTHLMEAIPVPVFFKDVNHTYVGCNNAFAQFVGLPKERIVGKPVFDVVSHETAEIFKQHDETLFRNPGAQVYATSVKRSDGSTREVIFHKATYGDPDGSVLGLIGVILDITDRRILEQQLFQAQKMEAVGTLAGGVAHDFNNLLQVVLGYSELILSDGDLLAQYREDLTKVNQAARNGADLVQRLLTFSRKTEVKPRPLNLNRRIVQLQKMLSRTIPKMIEIKLISADDLAAINADPTQMEQVLMNLALNARDAMPEGGRLTIQTENVILDADYCKTHLEAEPGRYVMLSVSDTGQGMDKNTVQHIFEPFFTTKGPGEGTGLGLAMVYGIVKQHGGHIMCYSEPGQGTIFKMYFPALVSGEEPRATETRAVPPGGSETILLVDDEKMIRDLCSRILTKSGYNVITASNGKEALELYREQREKISLVILDLIMPEMGGRQCLEGLLTLDPAVKVVIATGYSGKDSAGEALTSGAKGFIDKPYDVRQVLGVVRAVLDDKMEPEERLD